MNCKPIVISLSCALAIIILRRVDFDRTLGSSMIEGTDLKCQIIQSRSIGNMLGSGATEIWFSVIDPEGIWIQNQRIHIIGEGATKWVTWAAPESIATKKRGNLAVIPIGLKLPSGRTTEHEVVVGIQ
jgi:hypothetical protein